jgi:hypothetical protein
MLRCRPRQLQTPANRLAGPASQLADCLEAHSLPLQFFKVLHLYPPSQVSEPPPYGVGPGLPHQGVGKIQTALWGFLHAKPLSPVPPGMQPEDWRAILELAPTLAFTPIGRSDAALLNIRVRFKM